MQITELFYDNISESIQGMKMGYCKLCGKFMCNKNQEGVRDHWLKKHRNQVIEYLNNSVTLDF